MGKILAIADDLTGALDTGVQFAGRGISTKVVTAIRAGCLKIEGDWQALVINTETRHLSGHDAGKMIYQIVQDAINDFTFIYKKTDSALRGNIGSELSALLAASGEAALLYQENHSLGEWFPKRLLPMM